MKSNFTKLTRNQLQEINGGSKTLTYEQIANNRFTAPLIEDDRDKKGGRP